MNESNSIRPETMFSVSSSWTASRARAIPRIGSLVTLSHNTVQVGVTLSQGLGLISRLGRPPSWGHWPSLAPAILGPLVRPASPRIWAEHQEYARRSELCECLLMAESRHSD